MLTQTHTHSHTQASLPHPFSWPSIFTDTLLSMIALVGISISRGAACSFTQTHWDMLRCTHTHTHSLHCLCFSSVMQLSVMIWGEIHLEPHVFIVLPRWKLPWRHTPQAWPKIMCAKFCQGATWGDKQTSGEKRAEHQFNIKSFQKWELLQVHLEIWCDQILYPILQFS